MSTEDRIDALMEEGSAIRARRDQLLEDQRYRPDAITAGDDDNARTAAIVDRFHATATRLASVLEELDDLTVFFASRKVRDARISDYGNALAWYAHDGSSVRAFHVMDPGDELIIERRRREEKREMDAKQAVYTQLETLKAAAADGKPGPLEKAVRKLRKPAQQMEELAARLDTLRERHQALAAA